MTFINFDVPNASGHGFHKEAVNTDHVMRAYYNASNREATFNVTYVGQISKHVRGSTATDIYRHIQALPNFVEVSDSLGAGGVKLFNVDYALHLSYQEKGEEEGETSLTIDYGISDEITERRSTDVPRVGGVTSSGRHIQLKGDQAEAFWKKYQGKAV
jgi:hypothetical protein